MVSHRQIGSPELPSGYKNLRVEIIESYYRLLSEQNIYPKQDLLGFSRQTGNFAINKSVYERDKDFPLNFGSVTPEDRAVIRGHELLVLKISPVQYNPVKKLLKVYSHIRLKLVFEYPPDKNIYPEKLFSQPFEQMLANIVLNYQNPIERQTYRLV